MERTSCTWLAIVLLAAATPERRAPVIPFWGYMPSSSTNLLYIHDLQQVGYPLLSVLTVGSGPRGVAVSNALNRVYVANFGAGSISVIDTQTLTVAATLVFPGDLFNPTELILSPDNQFLFVACAQTGPFAAELLKISTATNTIVEKIVLPGTTEAFDVALRRGSDQGGAGVSQIYITTPASNLIQQIRYGAGIANNATGATSISLNGAMWVDVSPDGSKIYVQQDNPLATPAPVSTATSDWSVAPTFTPIAGVPGGVISGDIYREIAFSSVTSPSAFAFLVNDWPSGKRLDVIDGSVDNFIGNSTSVAVGFNPRTVSIDPTGTVAFVGPGPGTLQSTVESYSLLVPSSPSNFANTISGEDLIWRVGFGVPNPAPVITEFCPHGGPTAGGNTVTIQGSGFSAGGQVVMNGIACPAILVVSSTQIVATAPSGGAGRGDVERLNLDLQSALIPQGYLFSNVMTTKSFTALPGTTAPEYQMYAWPLIADWPQAKASLLAAFGPYDPQLWRAFAWDAATQSYLEFPQIPDTFCETTGRAFWVLSRFGGTASLLAMDSDSGQSNLPIALSPGWNMVSFPFDNLSGFPSNAGEWNILGANPIGATSDFLTIFPASLPNPIVSDLLYEWTAAGYVTTNLMEPGRGYWVYNSTGATAWLIFTDPFFKPGPAPPAKLQTPLAAGGATPPPPPGGTAAFSGKDSSSSCSFGGGGFSWPAWVGVLLLVFLIRRGR